MEYTMNSRRLRTALAILMSATLAACGGGGSNGSDGPGTPPVTNAGTFSFSLSATTVSEADGTVAFTVNRSGGSDGAAVLEVRIVGGSASPASDVSLSGSAIEFADGDTVAKQGGIVVINDDLSESDETVDIELVLVSGGGQMGASTVTMIIIDDDAVDPPPTGSGYGLNDTGVTNCVDGFGTEYDCSESQVLDYPGQDASSGRDVNEPADNDGRAGFVFSKLDVSGAPLDDQSADYAVTSWDCVQDHVTGLTWEVKTPDGGLRDWNSAFRWRLPRRGEPSPETSDPVCNGIEECSVRAYVDALNAEGLCGRTDWRVPTRHELLSLVDFGSPTSAAVDESFFPNTAQVAFWTSSRSWSGDTVNYVEFDEGLSAAATPATALRVRLVSGGD